MASSDARDRSAHSFFNAAATSSGRSMVTFMALRPIVRPRSAVRCRPEGNGSFGGTLSPNLSPRPANGSPFQPTPANSRMPVRFCDVSNLRGKTRRPRSEVSVLANRRLQPLGHLTARTASIRRARTCRTTLAPWWRMSPAFRRRLVPGTVASLTIQRSSSCDVRGQVPAHRHHAAQVEGSKVTVPAVLLGNCAVALNARAPPSDDQFNGGILDACIERRELQAIGARELGQVSI